MFLFLKEQINLKADSRELRLTHAADGCIYEEIGNFLFFRTVHFYQSRTCQTLLARLNEP